MEDEKPPIPQSVLDRNRAVSAILDTPGWRIIESVHKAKIRRLYAGLLTARGIPLENAQAEIDMRLKFLGEIASLAGQQMTWKGYKSFDEAYEHREEDELLAEIGESALSGSLA